jgi:hypothetical protein
MKLLKNIATGKIEAHYNSEFESKLDRSEFEKVKGAGLSSYEENGDLVKVIIIDGNFNQENILELEFFAKKNQYKITKENHALNDKRINDSIIISA